MPIPCATHPSTHLPPVTTSLFPVVTSLFLGLPLFQFSVVSDPALTLPQGQMNEPGKTQLAPTSCILKVLAFPGDLVGLSFVTREAWALSCVKPGLEKREWAGKKEGGHLRGGQRDLEVEVLPLAQK